MNGAFSNTNVTVAIKARMQHAASEKLNKELERKQRTVSGVKCGRRGQTAKCVAVAVDAGEVVKNTMAGTREPEN